MICIIEDCGARAVGRGMCPMHYSRFRAGNPLRAPRRVTGLPLAQRLEDALEYGAPSGCWLWPRAIDSKGYGMIGVGPRNHRAHRAAWMAWRGPIPAGLRVLHRCDTPPCCNPAHLFLGTDWDNAVDREAKGRGRQPAGERHSRAKLTNATAAAARRRLERGEQIKLVARSLGVSYQIIWRIKHGYSWNLQDAI